MLPIKIVKDVNPSSAPDNSSNLNVNVNFDILKNAIVNEQGFDKLNFVFGDIIGSCILPDNTVCVFSTLLSGGVTYSVIGIVDGEKYKIVLVGGGGTSLGFTTEHQIKAEAKVNFNGDYIVYWVNGFNPDRWLNLTNPQVNVTIIGGLPFINSAADLNLMLSFIPKKGEYIDNTATTITGGTLPAAVYYVIVTYGDKYKNFTKPLYVSSPIPVVASSIPYGVGYIGSKAGDITDKAIQFTIDGARLNTEYTYLRVQVIKKQNQVLTGWTFGTFSFTSADFTCVIDRLTIETTVDSILINLADYKSSLAITQLDDVLYKAHLKSRNRFNFQPYINNIKTNYIQKEIDLSLTTAGNNFRDPNMCFYSKGFMYDEVYALYVSFIIEEEGFEYETDAYHIPGRKAGTIDLGGTVTVAENISLSDIVAGTTGHYVSTNYYDPAILDLPVNQIHAVNADQSKLFHAITTADFNTGLVGAPSTNMGYWENYSEEYLDNNSWLIKNSAGTQTNTFIGDKVRHHKFPEPTTVAYVDPAPPTPSKANYLHPSDTNYNLVNILGIQFSNVVIPVEYTGKIKNIKMYYAKRDYNNRTILGQSLLETLNGLHNYLDDPNPNTRDKIFNGIGNMSMISMVAPSHSSGIFPLTYNRGAVDPWYTSSYTETTYPTDNYSGYMKVKPFDMMQQSLSPNYATHIKNMYRIYGKYDGTIFDGTLSSTTTGWQIGTIFDPTGNHNYGLFVTDYYRGIEGIINLAGISPYRNMHRKIVNAEYVNLNTPSISDTSYISSPYNFTMFPYNFNGEKAIWVQTYERLSNSTLPPTYLPLDPSYINYDIPRIKMQSNSAFDESFSNYGEGFGAYACPYVSNICAFKLNLFENFDNQILCDAGVIPFGGTYSYYDGDTFTNVYGERETMNLHNFISSGSVDGYMTGIHNYICQTTSNVNYRYEGNNNWEVFYPTTNYDTISKLPIGINEEWYGYNPDYSAVNDLLQPVIQSNSVNQFQTLFPNRVIRSATDNPETMEDNYLIYEAGNYKDFGKAKGPIQNITNQNNKLVIKTNNALFYTLGREVINTQNSESYVGAGDIFAVKPKESVSSNSYGGGLGRFSDVVTQYGYMYVDQTNGIVYNAAPSNSGDSINEISNDGLQIFFRNELKFKLPNQLTSAYIDILSDYTAGTYVVDWYVRYNNEIWKSVRAGALGNPLDSNDWERVDFFTLMDNTTDIQGIGVVSTFDYKYRRYILAKKDFNYQPINLIANIPVSPGYYGSIVYYNGVFYELCLSSNPNGIELIRGSFGIKINFDDYFEDKSFTMAYYPESKAWVSLYTYYPNFLFNTVDKVYSTQSQELFKHNSDMQNSFFYDRVNPISSFVEPILNAPAGIKKYASLSFYTDVFTKNFQNLQTLSLDYLETFTSYFVRNTWQMSKPVDIVNTVTSRNSERYFLTNDFRDYTRDNKDALMTSAYIPQQNAANLNLTKHWSLQKKFVDYYLIPRLEFFKDYETIDLGANYIQFFIDNTTNQFTFVSNNYTFNMNDTIRFYSILYETTYTINITKLLSTNTYEFTSTPTIEGDDIGKIYTFDLIPYKQLYIYDISSTQTKNIR